jgi:hypothetical protein
MDADMADFDKLVVALAIVFGWTLGTAFLAAGDRPTRRLAASPALTAITILALSALVLHLRFSGNLASLANDLYPERAGELAQLLVRFAVGMLAGASLAGVGAAIRRGGGAAAGLLLVPFMVFFVAAFFADELRRGYFNIARLEAGGVTLDFDIRKETTNVGFSYDDAGSPPTRFDTDFEFGVNLISLAVNSFESDYRRLAYCGKNRLFNCDNFFVKAYKNIEDDPLKIDPVGSYMADIRPFSDCLSAGYVKFFPAGLPIQPMLHNIAAAFTVPVGAAEAQVAASAGRRHYSELDDLVLSLHNFTAYVARFEEADLRGGPANGRPAPEAIDKAAIDRACSLFTGLSPKFMESSTQSASAAWTNPYNYPALPPEGERTLEDVKSSSGRDAPSAEDPGLQFIVDAEWRRSNSNQFGEAFASWPTSIMRDIAPKDGPSLARPPGSETLKQPVGDWLAEVRHKHRALREGATVLPHKPLLEAAIIASAGFPSEAATHLERERRRLERERRNKGITEGTFPDFLLSTRILYPLEILYERVGLRDAQLDAGLQLLEEIGAFLSRAKPFTAGNFGEFVRWCGEQPSLLEKVDGEGGFDEATADDVEVFLRTYVDLYFRQSLRSARALAESRDREGRSEIGDRMRRASADLVSLFRDAEPDIEKCLHPVYRKSPKSESVIPQLRFETFAVHGLLTASLSEVAAREVDGSRVLWSGYGVVQEKTLCQARNALDEARRTAARQQSGERVVSADNELYVRTVDVGDRLHALPLSCG